ncbi:sensor histidine kinase [Clostridium beijerinckii]|uniref:sensor histidine kinase n=1 Tax=Clostridium beijerinckii TaxID=1520 RepID=UPI00232CAFE2|nr:sensor histidine kinase [Clostridium beijerinckii]
MDTKLKNSKKSYVTNLVTFIIFLIMSVGIFNIYPNMRGWAKAEPKSPFEEDEFLRTIYKNDYVLYKDLVGQTNHEELSGDKIYISSYDTHNDTEENTIRNFNYELSEWKNNLNNNYKNLDYLVYSDDANITNTNNDLKELISDSEVNNLKNKYSWYMTVKYDNTGLMSISNIYGADANIVKNAFSGLNIREIWGYPRSNEENVKFNPIKNVTFIYGIPKDLKYTDGLSRMIDESQNQINIAAVVTIILGIVSVILILSLLIPYKKGKEVFGIKYFSKIPFEINCFIFGIGGIVIGTILVHTVIETLRNRLAVDLIGSRMDKNLEGFTVISVNIIMWMAAIYIIFAGVMLLKSIINFGVIKYLKENLLIIKISRQIKKLFSNVFNYIGHIDLNDKSNKFIIKVIGVNLIIMLICCIFWFFGIVIALIYNMILFHSIRKQYGDIRNKFSILLNEADRIAGGNLEVEIEDDLGLFNPLKDRIEKIKDGLKKAVSEEVKSQRMKTELISNVSHDLKTPLTSIITYTDLLKKDNLTEEERKSYIDTIDKKSQRLKFLIEDLFEVSKATSGDIKLNLVNVDIVELMRQTQIELDDKIKDSKLILKNSYPASKVILNLDSQKTFRIFENLIINVVKYAMKGSRVYVDIIDHEKNVEITIKNMSAEELNFDPFDIVDRFQRGDKSRNTEGSGLGLAIAKSFVEVQGGTFNIEIDGDLFKVVIKFNK